MRVLYIAVAVLLAGCTVAPSGTVPTAASERPAALVVASNALAAEAGAEILRAGGNAVDAAAAVALALTVVEPHLSGIGGGGFLLYRTADGAVTVLDGRETAPAGSTADQFLLPGGAAPMPAERATTRGVAVGVPGAVALWDEALRRHGTLGWAEVAAPALRYAEDGFEVNDVLANSLASTNNRAKLLSWPESARTFYKDAQCPPATTLSTEVGCVATRPYVEGETMTRPDLARTLRILQETGASGFYEGDVAEAIVEAVAARDGRMTTHDLAAYRVVEREPLSFPYHGYEVLSMPPPGGGVVVLQMLGILEPMGIAEGGHNTGQTLHKVIEAQHLAYADRAAYLADPAFVDVPVKGLLDPDYLAERRALIGERANADVRPGDPGAHEGGSGGARPADTSDVAFASHTSHFAVVDHAGNVASATATIEAVFGTGIMVPGYGFLLNNELTDFSYTPGVANEVEPGKRPRSAMSPTIVLLDGEPVLVAGAAGGPTIIMSVFQLLQNALEHGLSAKEAIEAGRVYSPEHGTAPSDVAWDRDVPQEARDELRARGHAPSPTPAGGLGRAAIALRVDGAWTGAAEVRGGPGGVVIVP